MKIERRGGSRGAALRSLAMRSPAPALASVALVTVVATLAGCGGSSSSTTSSASSTTGAQSPKATATTTSSGGTTSASSAAPSTTIEATIPGLLEEGYFPKRNTCDGANVSFAARWSKIPAGTAALAMFLLNLKPVHGKLFFDWAVMNLSPTSHGIPPGVLPAGAVVGRNSFGQTGYSICPPKGTVEEHFILRLVALPHPIAAKQGFDAETLYNEAERSAKVVGLAGGVYTRR